MKRIFAILGLMVVAILVTNCGNDDRTKLFEAQVCIDQIPVTNGSTASELSTSVDACMEKISSLSSSDSYILRCSGDFIKQGIAETKIVAAIDGLGKKEEGEDSTATTMENLAFRTIAESDLAVENCNLSDSNTLIALAGLANLSTILGVFASGIDNIDTFVDNFDPSDLSSDQKVELANSLLNSQSSLCDPSSGLASDSEVCENINNSVGDGATTEAQKQVLIDDFMASLKD